MYFSYIVQAINSYHLGDINLPNDGGYLKQNTFTMEEQARDITLTADEDFKALKLEVKHLNTHFKSNEFRYKLWFIPIDGHITAQINDISMTMLIQPAAQEVNGRFIPAIMIFSANVDIKSSHMKIDLGGSFMAKIADLFIALFKPILKGTIVREIVTVLKTKVPQQLNHLLQKDQGYAHFWMLPGYETLTLDYALESPPLVNQHYLGFGINGTMFNQGREYWVPESKIPGSEMPFKNKEAKSKF